MAFIFSTSFFNNAKPAKSAWAASAYKIKRCRRGCPLRCKKIIILHFSRQMLKKIWTSASVNLIRKQNRFEYFDQDNVSLNQSSVHLGFALFTFSEHFTWFFPISNKNNQFCTYLKLCHDVKWQCTIVKWIDFMLTSKVIRVYFMLKVNKIHICIMVINLWRELLTKDWKSG